jgi:hypothetical protein
LLLYAAETKKVPCLQRDEERGGVLIFDYNGSNSPEPEFLQRDEQIRLLIGSIKPARRAFPGRVALLREHQKT